MTTISRARARNGIAAATARAAWGVGFQAIAIRAKAAGIAVAAGIRMGRPLSSSTASRVARAAAASSVARGVTMRSAATAYVAIQRGSSPISTCHSAEGAAAPAGVGALGHREAGTGAKPGEDFLRLLLALARILLELLDETRRQGAAAGIGRHRDGDADRIEPDMQHVKMSGERPGDRQRRGKGCGIAVAAARGDQDCLDHRTLSSVGAR